MTVDFLAGTDPEATEGMVASIDTYLALMRDCKCDGLCTCDDSAALKAAQMSFDIRPQGC